MQRRSFRFAVSWLAFGAAGLVAGAALSESVENLVRRYPYDPACLWGRLANGKGTIVRCLSEQEAAQLAPVANALPIAPAAPPAPPPPPSVAPVVAASASVTPAPATAAVMPEPVAKPGRFEVTVGPVTADHGDLPLGKLGQPKDRYSKCLEDNGGLHGESGEVSVRFLVRSKGIAEGVSVQKRVNVSAEAARCVSEVVDRRHVGVPDEPLVGATVVVKFTNHP
ncbi:MAG TPA: hypothetical protein VMI54_08395 [Polyangiaceae bacterium]|nr:hypothetical protein [Polyangiaceae bacterium]